MGGKGGVGKTTVAAALAVARAERGERVVAVSVDPAHSLGDALGVALGADPAPIPGLPLLSALELDAEVERARFLEAHRGELLATLERGTYLDRSDAEGLVDLTLPGIDELAALFRIQQLHQAGNRLIVDTAPTGHTLRLLDLPELARAWVDTLRAMEDRSRAVSTALVGSYQTDEVSELLDQLDRELTDLADLLTDPHRTRFILVTTREPVVLAESRRYQEQLAQRHVTVGGLVVNRSTPAASAPSEGGVPMAVVPVLESPPVGVSGLRAYAELLLGGAPVPPASEPPTPGLVHRGVPYKPPPDRWIHFVCGKGGVGKSTTAAALAVRLREEGRTVLLLGIDPAGSLGDVLGVAVEAGGGDVPIAEGLVVRQLDATAAWESFRSGYQAEVERVFSALISGGRAGADASVVQRLVDLAPPGIDELAALVEVVDASEDRPYDAVVVDTAPTGHFLRLLELPEVALEWTHQAMRLLLKYREVVPPGQIAERLLSLAKSLRRFGALLRDPSQSWLLVVALPEELSVTECRRLLDRLEVLAIPAGALLINRLGPVEQAAEVRSAAAAALTRLARDRGLPALAAPALPAGPVGAATLSTLAHSWVKVEVNVQENSE